MTRDSALYDATQNGSQNPEMVARSFPIEWVPLKSSVKLIFFWGAVPASRWHVAKYSIFVARGPGGMMLFSSRSTLAHHQSPTAMHAATSPHRHPCVSMPRCEVLDLRGSRPGRTVVVFKQQHSRTPPTPKRPLPHTSTAR